MKNTVRTVPCSYTKIGICLPAATQKLPYHTKHIHQPAYKGNISNIKVLCTRNISSNFHLTTTTYSQGVQIRQGLEKTSSFLR